MELVGQNGLFAVPLRMFGSKRAYLSKPRPKYNCCSALFLLALPIQHHVLPVSL